MSGQSLHDAVQALGLTRYSVEEMNDLVPRHSEFPSRLRGWSHDAIGFGMFMFRMRLFLLDLCHSHEFITAGVSRLSLL